jgi:hypothetical protein
LRLDGEEWWDEVRVPGIRRDATSCRSGEIAGQERQLSHLPYIALYLAAS